MNDLVDGLVLVMALGFGVGLSPIAPGTVGSMAGFVPAFALSRLKAAWHLLVIVLLGALGVWVCALAARILGEKDPGMIVFDEIVGLLIAVFRLPWRWYWLLSAFLLYRFFDILKPWPVSAAEQWFGLGGGIMADDVFSGGMALVIVGGIYQIKRRSLPRDRHRFPTHPD